MGGGGGGGELTIKVLLYIVLKLHGSTAGIPMGK